MRVSIEQFGAKTTANNNATSIQVAINEVAKTGGTVVIPTGVYQTGTIKLLSGVTLEIERGAVLKGSTDMADYPETGLVHNELGMVKALIFAEDAENIAIVGEGKIDYQGNSFFDFSKPNSPDLDLTNFNERQLNEYAVRIIDRPNSMIFIEKCQNVTIEGIQLLDAACWNVVLNSCEVVKVHNVVIRGNKRIPNDDGIHLCSCKNAIVSNCDIFSGDDCIAISGINDWKNETRNIIVSDCLLSSASAGIRIGYWRSKVSNVKVNNCLIYDTGRGICFNACNSGFVRDVTISNLTITNQAKAGRWWGRGEALYFNGISYDLESQKGHEFDLEDVFPNISNITIDNLTIKSNYPYVFVGEEKNIQDIHINNAQVTVENTNNRDVFGNEIDLRPNTKKIPVPENASFWLYAEQVKDASSTNITVKNALQGKVKYVEQKVRDCENITLQYKVK